MIIFRFFMSVFILHDQVPVILIVSWVNAIPMDLDFNLLETGSLAMAVITTAFTLQVIKIIANRCTNFFFVKTNTCRMNFMSIILQDDKWHYLKGLNLVFSYIVIAVCFFVMKALPSKHAAH